MKKHYCVYKIETKLDEVFMKCMKCGKRKELMRKNHISKEKIMVGGKIHWCGCITKKDSSRTIHFEKMCRRHQRNRKYPWIALQHDEPERATLTGGKGNEIRKRI